MIECRTTWLRERASKSHLSSFPLRRGKEPGGKRRQQPGDEVEEPSGVAYMEEVEKLEFCRRRRLGERKGLAHALAAGQVQNKGRAKAGPRHVGAEELPARSGAGKTRRPSGRAGCPEAGCQEGGLWGSRTPLPRSQQPRQDSSAPGYPQASEIVSELRWPTPGGCQWPISCRGSAFEPGLRAPPAGLL